MLMSTVWMPQLIVLAQAETPPDEISLVGSVWELIVKGGILMIPIAVCSFVALAVLVERAVSLRRLRVLPAALLGRVRAAVRTGDHDDARRACEADGSPLATLLGVALRHRGQPRRAVEGAVSQAGERVVFGLRRFTRVLTTIVAVAPMLGLLGTIFGMISAFQTVAASAEALGRTEALATGIYEALVTTAAGLLVAIPALLGYHWTAARVDRLMVDLDAALHAFLDELLPAASTEPRPVKVASKPESAMPRASGQDGRRPLVEMATVGVATSTDGDGGSPGNDDSGD